MTQIQDGGLSAEAMSRYRGGESSTTPRLSAAKSAKDSTAYLRSLLLMRLAVTHLIYHGQLPEGGYPWQLIGG